MSEHNSVKRKRNSKPKHLISGVEWTYIKRNLWEMKCKHGTFYGTKKSCLEQMTNAIQGKKEPHISEKIDLARTTMRLVFGFEVSLADRDAVAAAGYVHRSGYRPAITSSGRKLLVDAFEYLSSKVVANG